MSYMLPHLENGWQVDQAILAEEDRVVIIRFGHDWDPTCMQMDETLFKIAPKVKNFAVVYLVDITKVPDFNKMYELYDPCTVMFFFRNKHIMVDLGTGNNNKINWAINDGQELIDIVETVYRGARKGRESNMPFMHGSMPLRRTFFYLQQGKIKFRDSVHVFALGFNRRPTPEQAGARDFAYWHWAQLQYHNPKVQLVKHVDKVITPFARAYLVDGREVLFDLENMKREEIEEVLAKTLGKTELVERRERLESIAKLNPADFGSKNERQCICEVQGQHPCTGLLKAPKCVTGKWRWNHNLI